jgi:hypothetical protein
MIEARLFGADRQRRGLSIDSVGAALVSDRNVPPFGVPTEATIFRQYMLDASGSNDMRVAGSLAVPQRFKITPAPNADRYIVSLSFLIADASSNLNQFGNIAALTNGCRLFYSQEVGEFDIHDQLKTNFDFIRLCQGNPSFGDAATAFRANNISGTVEGYIPVLDVRVVFGFKWGLRLKFGNVQELVMEIRDDTTGIDALDCIVYGFDRLPD